MKNKFLLLVLGLMILSGCSSSKEASTSTSTSTSSIIEATISDNLITFDYEYVDYKEDDYTTITCNGSSVEDNSNVTIKGTTITISNPGTYEFSGTLNEGQIHVNSTSKGLVRIVFNNFTINNSSTSPVYIEDATQTTITLQKNSNNEITDSSASTDELSAAIHSKDNLVFDGEGSLKVSTTNDKDCITSRDELYMISGNYILESSDDGIVGKDYLVIKGGTYDISALHDGIKSTNEEDENMGILQIDNGTLNINTSKDDGTSSKGLKAITQLSLLDGEVNIDTVDDGIHSDGKILIKQGTYTISTSDDGIHANEYLVIDGGTINVLKSYEALEGAIIEINDGDISLIASDDGINASSDLNNNSIFFNGGTVYVDASGDGLDSNGSIEMNGGVVYVDGPTSGGNGALDYDNSFIINSGTLVAVGTADMLQTPSSDSSQNIISVTASSYSANSKIEVYDSSNNVVLSYSPKKAYQSIVLSSSEFKTGESYTVKVDGTTITTLTISSTISSYGSAGYQPGAGGMNGQPPGGFRR